MEPENKIKHKEKKVSVLKSAIKQYKSLDKRSSVNSYTGSSDFKSNSRPTIERPSLPNNDDKLENRYKKYVKEGKTREKMTPCFKDHKSRL